MPRENRKTAAVTIAYGILYGNNAIDVSQFFDDYPELIDIAELALEFDFETDAAYLDNRWRLLANKVETFIAHMQEANRGGKNS